MRHACWVLVAVVGCSANHELAPPRPDTAPVVNDTASSDTSSVLDAVSDIVEDVPTATLTVTTVPRPRGIAVGGGYVFVTSFEGAIYRAPTSGGIATKIAAPIWPTYVATDSTHVYWTDMGKPGAANGGVGRVPIAGGMEQILTTGHEQPNSCALFGGNAYFARPATVVGTTGSVHSVPIAGGGAATIADAQTTAAYVAVDGARVCWAAARGIVCKKDGVIRTIASDEPSPVRALAIDATHAFYAQREGVLRRESLDGDSYATLDSGPFAGFGSDVALDATHAYWISGHEVRKVAKTGGPGVLLDSGTRDAIGMTIDATDVYWVTTDGKVMRRPK